MLFLFTKSGQMAHVESRDRHADGDLKKELKVLSIPTHSITPEASVLLKIEIRNSVLLEIAGNTHSPFCQYFADYSACVLPALQKDSISDFIFGKN